MSRRRWASYYLDQEKKQRVRLCYDPEKPGRGVDVVFPAEMIRLTPHSLTELGIIFLALSRFETTDTIEKALSSLGLEPPNFLRSSPTAKELARELVSKFIAVFAEIAELYKNNESLRYELEGAIARHISKLGRQE